MEELAELSRLASYSIATGILAFGFYLWKRRREIKLWETTIVTLFSVALVLLATAVIRKPVPQTGDYLNLGDTMIMFAAMVFGPAIGAFAGGVGSAIADLALGYSSWAPVTLLVKGLEGFIIGYASRKLEGTSGMTVAAVLGGTAMVVGYFLFEYKVFGLSSAYNELQGNIVQAVTGVIVGTGLTNLVKKKFPKVWEI
ncbi:ECF transporter S component [Thermococcus sp.]